MLWRILTLLLPLGQSRWMQARSRRRDREMTDVARLNDAQREVVAKAVAAELEEDRRLRAEDDRNRVEPDFLALVWASVAVALAVAGQAAGRAVPMNEGPPTVVKAVWGVVALVAGLFVVTNVAFAIRLTRRYARSKSDSSYEFYAISLAFTIGVIVVGTAALVLLGVRASSG
jgi:hypothetical protein